MAEVEKFSFQPGINQLINTFFSNKDIFLRELISYSSHALDNTSLYGQPEVLFINVRPNTNSNTLTIFDNGVGMTKSELLNNLSNIPTSGTTEFMKAIAAGADLSMISHFGVWLSSAHMVADKVVVTTKHNNDHQYVMESLTPGSFTVTRDISPRHNIARGTKIELYLKENQLQYLEERRLKDLIKQHSMSIRYPVSLTIKKVDMVDISPDDDDDEKKKDEEGQVDGKEKKEMYKKRRLRFLFTDLSIRRINV